MNTVENSIVELGRLKLVKEMFDLLTEDEKRAIALQYVTDWCESGMDWIARDQIERVFREVIQQEAQKQIDRLREQIAKEIEKHIARGVVENEAWQTATWRQQKQ